MFWFARKFEIQQTEAAENIQPFQSYSSHGEDAIFFGILRRLSWITEENMFVPKTYLDVGAYLPKQDSNTYALYLQGWRGTLVEPNPALIEQLRSQREGDLIEECAVNSSGEDAFLSIFFDDGSSNTISQSFAETIAASQQIAPKNTVAVEAKTLDQIMSSHIQFFGEVPFLLDLDIEGVDESVLLSYGWESRPTFIWVEDLVVELGIPNKIIQNRLMQMEYFPVAQAFLSTLYVDQNSKYFSALRKYGPN